MAEKQKIELEYLLKSSLKVFEPMVNTPSGLSDWFADDVNIKGDRYFFKWDKSEEEAVLVGKKQGSYMRWHWVNDEDEDSYFELRYEVDPMTKSLVLHVTDFAAPDDVDEVKMLWESSIADLKRVLGA